MSTYLPEIPELRLEMLKVLSAFTFLVPVEAGNTVVGWKLEGTSDTNLGVCVYLEIPNINAEKLATVHHGRIEDYMRSEAERGHCEFAIIWRLTCGGAVLFEQTSGLSPDPLIQHLRAVLATLSPLPNGDPTYDLPPAHRSPDFIATMDLSS